MIFLVEDKKAEIAEVCRRYGVEWLDFFGSAAGEGFDPGCSDPDFVVTFERTNPSNLFDRYFGLKEDLKNLFGREADLLMDGALHKDRRFAEVANGKRVALYAA